MISLTIDGIKVKVEPGTTLLEAARSVGITIPTLCHDPILPNPGSCRLCVVEVAGMRSLAASCVTAATEGMVVQTASPAVVEARKTILELLIANHPMDCLTCQRSGDCRLQDYAYQYGVKEVSFQGERHAYPIDDSNPYIYRDSNKCILCGKCVRACAEVEDRKILDFAYRGFNTKVATALDLPLGESDCVSCHRCVAVCPVGALVDPQIMGKGRRWDLEKEEVTCQFCESGCRFHLNKKNGQVVGVTAAEPGPGRPLCLKGRLGTDLVYNPQRTESPLMRKDGKYVPVSWEEALGLGAIAAKLRELGKDS